MPIARLRTFQITSSIAPVLSLVSEFAAALKIKEENLRFVRMVGDSMKPTIDANNFFAIDTTEVDILNLAEAIYVFELNSTVFIRRFALRTERGYQASADNPFYKPFDIYPDETSQHFRILGRVIWVYQN